MLCWGWGFDNFAFVVAIIIFVHVDVVVMDVVDAKNLPEKNGLRC